MILSNSTTNSTNSTLPIEDKANVYDDYSSYNWSYTLAIILISLFVIFALMSFAKIKCNK